MHTKKLGETHDLHCQVTALFQKKKNHSVLHQHQCITPYTIFIRIDAHAQIDAHPLHHEALGTQKQVKSIIFVQKMHGFEVRF